MPARRTLVLALCALAFPMHLLADDNPRERDTLLMGPFVIHVTKKPSKDLEYDLCLSVVKRSDSDDEALLVAKLLDGDECPGVKGSFDKEIKDPAKVGESVADSDKPDASNRVKIDDKEWKYKFAPLAVYSKTEKGWDGFCASVIVKVDEPRGEGKLIACDKTGTVEKSGKTGKFLLCPKAKECYEKKFDQRVPRKVGS